MIVDTHYDLLKHIYDTATPAVKDQISKKLNAIKDGLAAALLESNSAFKTLTAKVDDQKNKEALVTILSQMMKSNFKGWSSDVNSGPLEIIQEKSPRKKSKISLKKPDTKAEELALLLQ